MRHDALTRVVMGNFEKFMVSHLIRSKCSEQTHVAITDTEESGSGA